MKQLHCNSEEVHCAVNWSYCNVATKNMINGLRYLLCIFKVLNVTLMIILWYLNENTHICNKCTFSWFYA